MRWVRHQILLGYMCVRRPEVFDASQVSRHGRRLSNASQPLQLALTREPHPRIFPDATQDPTKPVRHRRDPRRHPPQRVPVPAREHFVPHRVELSSWAFAGERLSCSNIQTALVRVISSDN